MTMPVNRAWAALEHSLGYNQFKSCSAALHNSTVRANPLARDWLILLDGL